MRFQQAAAATLLAAGTSHAVTLDIDSTDSIKTAARTVAYSMMTYYTGNETGGTPGLLPSPYYWWEAGAMWGSLIDYWYYTGDTTYNDIVSQALLFQTGTDNDFMPANQTKSEGNDDQGFWGMAAMSAAETKFPNPPDTDPQWLALAQAVFNSQALRWDTTSCAGGLKWQIFTFNNGYDYKNSISNGCFFNLAARLGYYTQNATYFEWANKMFDWVDTIGLMSKEYAVYDGTNDLLNCTQQNHIQWTYNAGVYLLGASVMWNQTNGTTQTLWETRVRGLITAASVFFENDTMLEVACEPAGNCDTDQQSFKAYLSRWMAASVKVAPFVEDLVSTYLQTSAKAAAQTCVGGTTGTMCGTSWLATGYDGKTGVGQNMNALEVIQGLLIDEVSGPVSNKTGGTSTGDSSAGTGGDSASGTTTASITTADKAGAGILTAVILVGLLGGAWWMIA